MDKVLNKEKEEGRKVDALLKISIDKGTIEQISVQLQALLDNANKNRLEQDTIKLLIQEFIKQTAPHDINICNNTFTAEEKKVIK